MQHCDFPSMAAGMFAETGKYGNPERNRNVSTALLPNPPQLRILDVVLAKDFSIRSLSARAALYARPRAKMAGEAIAQRRVRELDREENINRQELDV
jgi:hypothetical protein